MEQYLYQGDIMVVDGFAGKIVVRKLSQKTIAVVYRERGWLGLTNESNNRKKKEGKEIFRRFFAKKAASLIGTLVFCSSALSASFHIDLNYSFQSQTLQ